MILSLIVAMDEASGIGKDNRLLWHLPNDLKWFKRHTVGKPIIMGRKTYESIGRALPGRRNIVITRQADFQPLDVCVVSSLEAAYIAAEPSEECMVIGGAEIYTLALASAMKLYVTHVHAKMEATVFFPKIDWSEWVCESTEPHIKDSNHAFDYTFCIYTAERLHSLK